MNANLEYHWVNLIHEVTHGGFIFMEILLTLLVNHC